MIWLVLVLSIGFVAALAGWINTALRLEERKHDNAFWRQRAHAAETHCAALVNEVATNASARQAVAFAEAAVEMHAANVLKK